VIPSRCKQVDGLLGALALHLWRAFPTEVRRQEVRAILGALALVHAPVTCLQSPIGEAEPDECRVADSGIEKAWQHDQRGEVLRLPDRRLYCDPFRLRQEAWEPRGAWTRPNRSAVPRLLEDRREVVIIRGLRPQGAPELCGHGGGGCVLPSRRRQPRGTVEGQCQQPLGIPLGIAPGAQRPVVRSTARLQPLMLGARLCHQHRIDEQQVMGQQGAAEGGDRWRLAAVRGPDGLPALAQQVTGFLRARLFLTTAACALRSVSLLT
jgi:hypothetical protein